MGYRILIISREKSDLSDFICKTAEHVGDADIASPDSIAGMDLSVYDAFALLGGVSNTPLSLEPCCRNAMEQQIELGKRVFAEFCGSLMDYYFDEPVVSRYERLVAAQETAVCPLPQGTVLENQYNSRNTPYYCRDSIRPVLYAVNHVRSYRSTELTPELLEHAHPCLWFEPERPVLFCTFRLANFARSRFSPRGQWKQLIAGIVEWLAGSAADTALIPDYYHMGGYCPGETVAVNAYYSAEKGIAWYRNAGMLLEGGAKGVYEGIRSEITPDGIQAINSNCRADCIGESAFPFYLRYLLNGEAEDLAVSDRLLQYTFDGFLCGEDRFAGMLRWTREAWTVCYQDDVARAIFPALWRQQLTGDSPCYEKALHALDFLVATTGTDGLRRERTDCFYLEGEKLEELARTPGSCTSPNYNAYYLAALLLAYRLCGREKYRDTAVRGLTSIMEVYPDLYRMQSETHDLCRMILPLAYLYWVTGEEKHLQWLYRIQADMQKMKHPSGTYLEWDSGYKASLHNAAEGSESAVFGQNGDPITDCLYAVNWLPIAWLHAWCITGDSQFMKNWEEIARFFVNSQIASGDALLNGAWARSVDVELMEVSGMPDDVGWGPWCVETGWSMSQIISGLYMGNMTAEWKAAFRKNEPVVE